MAHSTLGRDRVHRRLLPDQVESLVASYRQGATTYELAQEFRIHRHTVTERLERRGTPRRYRSLEPDQIQQAIALYDTGLSLSPSEPRSDVMPVPSG